MLLSGTWLKMLYLQVELKLTKHIIHHGTILITQMFWTLINS